MQVPTYDRFQARQSSMPGTRLTAPEVPDIAGQQAQQVARGMQQTYMTTRGMTLANNSVLVDGLLVNGLQLDGGVQSPMTSLTKQLIRFLNEASPPAEANPTSTD